MAAYGHCAGGSVVEHFSEHAADDPRTADRDGGAEQRVEGGAVPVLPGSAHTAHNTRFDDQMIIRRSDEDPAVLEVFAIERVRGREAAGAIEARKNTRALRPDLENHQYYGG
jgi:hypothetical protein